MSRIDIRGYATAAIVCIWLVATVLFAFFTNVYWQLAAMVAFGLLSLCAIATLAYSMGRWREDGIVGVVPLVVCVLAFVLAPFLSSSIRTYRFHLNKPAYERVVEGMESGRIPVSERSYFGSSALAAGDAYLVAG